MNKGKELKEANDKASIKELNARLEEVIKQGSKEAQRDETIRLLSEYKGEDEIISSKDIKKLKVETVPSGYKDLDKMIRGFAPEDLVVISGATSGGKTLLAQNITSNLKEQGHNTVWFSFEMSASELKERFDHLPNKPVFYLPKTNSARDLVWLESRIVEAYAKYDCKFVVIDHTHYIVPPASDNSRWDLQVGEVVRNLKLIARKYEITIFLIHHTKKTEVDSAPTISDLRDTSFVGQEANTVLLVWRVPEVQKKRDIMENGVRLTNQTRVSVAKNRLTGKVGSVSLMFKDYRLYDYSQAKQDYGKTVTKASASELPRSDTKNDESSGIPW